MTPETLAARIGEWGCGTMIAGRGSRLLSAGEGRAVARLDFKPEPTRLTGPFHAGAIIALADETAPAAARGEIDPTGEFRPELSPLALQMSANLTRNTDQGTLVAEAEIVRRGRTTMPAERPGP